MKFLSVFLLAAALQVSARGYSQHVTLSRSGISLERVFEEIRRQTGCEFLYNSQMLSKAKKVSIDVKNASLSEVLEICFRDQPLTYSFFNKTIIVKIADPAVSIPDLAPPYLLKGRVLNENNDPVSGASVQIKGSKTGTVTNKDGEFTIRITGPEIVLVISYVGYMPIEYKPVEGVVPTLKLDVKKDVMEEVVTTGMYKRPKENFTGSSTTVTGDQIRQVNMVNALDALKIFDPAIRIPDNVQFGSDPNHLPQISLRGTNNFPQTTSASTVPSSGADFMANYGKFT